MVYSKMSVIQTKKFQNNMFVFWTDMSMVQAKMFMIQPKKSIVQT
jgi:hypothetical protein